MIEAFFLPFISTMLAELGDKTQLMIFCLSAKTKKRIQLLLGAVFAFFVADGLAVFIGKIAGNLIPELYVKVIAGTIFIIFGLLTIFKKEEEGSENCELKTPFISSFGLILAAEMGDKSQIMAAVFAAEYNAFLVLGGVVLAMTILSVAAVLLGEFISQRVNRKTISLVAGIIFLLIGLFTFVEIFFLDLL